MKKLSIIVLACAVVNCAAQNYTINFYVYPYPIEHLGRKKIDERVGPKYALKNQFYQPTDNRVYVLYNGYLTRSDASGFVSFPRKTKHEEFLLLVTESIKPIFALDNTVHGWQIMDPKHAVMYDITRYQDPETELYYWKAMETTIPENYIVPIHTITAVGKPGDVHVPLGITPTTKEPNLVLPPIYAKQGLDRIKHALFVINIKQFFQTITTTSQINQQSISTIIQP